MSDKPLTAEERAREIIGEPCSVSMHDAPGSIFCGECGRDAVREIAAEIEKAEREGERKGRADQAGEEWRLINDALRDFLADKKNGSLSVNDVLELYGILMEKGKR